eukprot:scaffold889_cov13-Prasinocladus_malaysianus.AAC.1
MEWEEIRRDETKEYKTKQIKMKWEELEGKQWTEKREKRCRRDILQVGKAFSTSASAKEHHRSAF